MIECQLIDMGKKDYNVVHTFQKELLEKRKKNLILDTLLFVEHFPVITIGRNGNKNNVLVSPKILEKENISIYHIERGGDVTYHGFGQLVIYPIFELKKISKTYDLHLVLRKFEKVIIKTLQNFGIIGTRKKDFTGVWIDKKKIASIGIAIKYGIMYHGISFNVNVKMKHFSFIKSCGIDGIEMTSLEQEIQKTVDMNLVKNRVINNFSKILNIKFVNVDNNKMDNISVLK